MLFEIINLGLDFAIFGILMKMQRIRQYNLEQMKSAPFFEINQDLPKIVSEHKNGVVPYAVVRGTILSNGQAIKSNYVHGVTGVIQELIVRERRAQWNPWAGGMWDVENDISRTSTSVPFFIADGSWWKNRVEVLDAPSAESLPLTVVYDHFTPRDDSIYNVISNWFKGGTKEGFENIEVMLPEGIVITGVGELKLINNEICLKAPKGELKYFLTLSSPEEVMEKLQKDASTLRSYAAFFGCLGAFLASWFIVAWQARRNREQEKQLALKRLAEARRRRRLAEQEARSRGEHLPVTNQPLCVVCMAQPVEMLVLECGHACLCMECGEQIHDTCPMCRSPISRTVPAYLP